MILRPDSYSDSSGQPRLLILVTEYSYFLSHKLPLVSAASEAGFDVIVAARCEKGAMLVPPAGYAFTLVPVPWRRTGSIVTAVLRLIPDVLRIRSVFADVRPDVAHCISLKPAIIGALAAYRQPVQVIHSINGFGFVFYAKSRLARFVQICCGFILRRSVTSNAGRIILQNRDDLRLVAEDFGVPDSKLSLIRGSGIDPLGYESTPEPVGPSITFLMLSRLLYMKGIAVAIDAFKILKERGVNATLVICGVPDPSNPSSIPQDVLDAWSQIPGVTFRGQLEDVKSALRDAHAVVHPALGGEGLPKALLEAAAMARPMIASDIAGNREIVLHEQTGLLVPPGDAEALANALERMSIESESRRFWGDAAREKVSADFSVEVVRQAHIEVYAGCHAKLGRSLDN
ncbi:MAG: glycosyltransferase family 4 protein [Rhodospirillaceae bacterium]